MQHKYKWFAVIGMTVAAMMSASFVLAETEKPHYGGRLNVCWAGNILFFDEAVGFAQALTPTMSWTNEELLTGDWTKGPTGTGEVSWLAQEMIDVKYTVGLLAESWEIVDDRTIIWHLRKGIHFHQKPPVNGREFVADDYIFSRERLLHSPRAWHTGYHSPEEIAAWSAEAIDKYTVKEKWYPGTIGDCFRIGGDYSFVVPREAVEKYGDLNDWKHSCGTGPFMLVDFVPQSSATLVRNPNYWRKHPLHPQDTMPYLDGIKVFLIEDLSTRLAAIRSGKIDYLGGYGGSGALEWDDAKSLMKTNPELKHFKYLFHDPSGIFWRLDKQELPYHDIRVRRALAMAVDRRALIDQYYDGQAELVTGPVTPWPEFKDFIVPMNELSKAAQETFGHQVEKAKKLLAEAGYPNGFEAHVVAHPTQVDLLSLIKYYWQQIGVDLKIDVKESTVFTSIVTGKNHPELIMGGLINATPRSMNNFRPGHINNHSHIDDKIINKAFHDMQRAFFDWGEIARIYREITPHIHEQCWWVVLPNPYRFAFWQPWVKGYSGEFSPGCWDTWHFYNYMWIDEKLKEDMKGKK